MSPASIGFGYVVSKWRVIVCCSFVCIGALQFGYDTSYFSGILVMDQFLEQFGTLNTSAGEYYLSASTQSFVTSIINAGEFVGAASAYYVGDRVGRKTGLYISSAFVIVGTMFQTVPTHIATLVVGRLLVGYAVGLISCLVPLYIADCAPTRLRGAVGAMYQFSVGMGLLVGVIATASTKSRNDTGAYRIPMSLQFLFPIILVPGLLSSIPESPRWLLEKGKDLEAERSLRKLLGSHPQEIALELGSIKKALESYQDLPRSSWKQTLKWGPEGRKAYLGMALQAFQQASGVNFITSYGVTFFTNLGMNDAFTIQLGLYLVGWPSCWISQYMMDRCGRRPMLIVSGLLMAVCLIVMGVCGVIDQNGGTDATSLDRVIVAMVYIFLFVFNLGWGPTVWVFTSEISTGQNRGRLMSLSTSSNWFFAWLVSFTFPYIYDADAGNLGPKVGFLFGGLVLCACAWVYLYLPETAGRSLEDIHRLFEMRVPSRQFATTDLTLADGSVTERISLQMTKSVSSSACYQ